MLALTISDPGERALPDAGLVSVRDVESGRETVIDTSNAAVRRAYERRATELRDQRRRTLAAVGVEEVPLSTGASYVEPLLRAFHTRARRR